MKDTRPNPFVLAAVVMAAIVAAVFTAYAGSETQANVTQQPAGMSIPF